MVEEASEQELVRESMDEDAVEQLEIPFEAVEEKPSEEPYPWPVIQYDVPPYRTYHFFNQFRTPSNPNNFLKGVKWYGFLLPPHPHFFYDLFSLFFPYVVSWLFISVEL